MSNLQQVPQLSPSELLSAIGQLGKQEFNSLVSQVLVLQAQRRTTDIPEQEAKLLTKINQMIPADAKARFDELKTKQGSQLLSLEEQNELQQLTKKLRDLVKQRAAYVEELEDMEDRRLLREFLSSAPTERLSEMPEMLRWEDVVDKLTDG